MKTPLAVQLGEFVAALRFDDLPSAVVDKAKALVNHAVTVAMAGAGAARVVAARRAVLAHEALGPRRIGAGQGATLWGDGSRVTRPGAVFASAVAVAVNNQCDSIYPTPGFNQPVVWLAREMTARHRLIAEEIEHVTLEMNYLETLYPSPRFPRPAAPDGSGFGRTAYMLAYTVVTGDYPVLARNVEDPRDAGASASADVAGRVAALQRQVEIIGAVGRPCFAPRLTVALRDGRRVTGEYHGRELMWDFARDARELRRFTPGLPIPAAQYDRLVTAIATLETARSVDEVVRLTLPA